MKTTLALIGVLFVVGPGVGVAAEPKPPMATIPPPGDHSFAFPVNGIERRALVHVPRGYDGRKPVPAVLMFHGAGGTSQGAMRQTGWTAKADEAGFLAIFPEGTCPDPSRPARFKDNPQAWNDGLGQRRGAPRNIDDVAFVGALLDDLAKRFAVDPQRVYACGFANGASMAVRAGAELANRIAAIAAVSGVFRLGQIKPERPVSLLVIFGTEDPQAPIEGRASTTRNGSVEKRPSAPDSAQQWAAALSCPSEPKLLSDRDGVRAIGYGPGSEDSEVVFYTIKGMGHTWPGGKSRLPEWMVGRTTRKLDATTVIWEFFTNHPKP